MLGRRRGGSSLIPGKGDAALAAAAFGKPPHPRCPSAAVHLTPSRGQLCPGIPWPHVASRRLISRSAAGSCPAPPPPKRGAPSCVPPGYCTHPASPSARVSGSRASRFPARPRQGRPPTPSLPLSSLFAALTPRLSPRSPSRCIPGMRAPSLWDWTFALTSAQASLLQPHLHPCPYAVSSLRFTPRPQTRFPHVPLGIAHLLPDAFLS